MGPLDLAIQLRCSALDIGVADALVLDMPVELGLELMAVIGPNFLDAEREPFNDVIDKVDRGILEAADFLAALAGEGEELEPSARQDRCAKRSAAA